LKAGSNWIDPNYWLDNGHSEIDFQLILIISLTILSMSILLELVPIQKSTAVLHLGSQVSPYLLALLLLNFCSCRTGESIPKGPADLAGTVTGPNGPEAGVWVIAETFDLPTPYAKIVVTDDEGRYLMPDLPTAKYSVWVRGYGLVDSPKKNATPGSNLDLEATIAPNDLAAAHYYPSGYWFSLLEVPDKSQFPGTGPEGNGISPNMTTQANFLRTVKSGTCLACHGLGNLGTRQIPEALGSFSNSKEAWARRIQSGQAGGSMISGVHGLGFSSADSGTRSTSIVAPQPLALQTCARSASNPSETSMAAVAKGPRASPAPTRGSGR
jgi:hypothetical protein